VPPPPAPNAAATPPPALAVVAEKKTTASKDEVALAAAAPAAPPAPQSLAKAASETDALSAASLSLQVERSINGRFEATEIGALRQGDRVRFRVRTPESGTLVMTAGAGVARSMLAEAGRTYYLPDTSGLPPGEAPVEVAIALHPASEQEVGNSLFRARQGAVSGVVGGVPGGGRANEPLRDARREDADKAKEQSVQTAGRTASVPRDRALGGISTAAPRQVRLRLEFKPR
jgi:hypothetical protein